MKACKIHLVSQEGRLLTFSLEGVTVYWKSMDNHRVWHAVSILGVKKWLEAAFDGHLSFMCWLKILLAIHLPSLPVLPWSLPFFQRPCDSNFHYHSVLNQRSAEQFPKKGFQKQIDEEQDCFLSLSFTYWTFATPCWVEGTPSEQNLCWLKKCPKNTLNTRILKSIIVSNHTSTTKVVHLGADVYLFSRYMIQRMLLPGNLT